jgi:hypothetical protein
VAAAQLVHGQGDQMFMWKNRPKCGPTHCCQFKYLTFSVEK